MKPIFLEFEAFGPYPQKQQIDFQTFGAEKGGLFLIQGETGAGKTILLDAMTCALYGKSSGETRGELEQMRCQLAQPTQVTEVTFIFESKGKRYRFYRKLRPKRRRTPDAPETFEKEGSANVDKQGVWEPLEEKITYSKIKDFATEVTGLTYDQFCQVVLLPQGKFEEFLVSDTKGKEAVLSTLFDNAQWESLAERMKNQSNAEKANLDELKIEIEKQLQAEGCESIEQMQELHSQKQEALLLLQKQSEEHHKNLLQQQEVYRKAEKLAELFDSVQQTEQEQQNLQQLKPQRQQEQKQLDLAIQAESAATAMDLAQAAKIRLQQAIAEYKQAEKNQKQAQERQEQTQKALEDANNLETEQEELKKIQTQTENLIPVYQKAEAFAVKQQESHQKLTHLAGQLLCAAEQAKKQLEHFNQTQQKTHQTLTNAEKQLNLYKQALNEMGDFSTKEKEFVEKQTQLKALLPIAKEFETAQGELEALQKRQTETGAMLAQTVSQEQKQLEQLQQMFEQDQEQERQAQLAVEQAEKQQQTLQTLFLQQSAAHLAEQLQEGEPCPVCGSVHHPHLAQKGEMVLPEQLEQAQQATKKAQDSFYTIRQKKEQRAQAIQSMQEKLLPLQQEAEKWNSAPFAGQNITQKPEDLLRELDKIQAEQSAKQKTIAQLQAQLGERENCSPQDIQEEYNAIEQEYKTLKQQHQTLEQQQQQLQQVIQQLIPQKVQMEQKIESFGQQSDYLNKMAQRWSGYPVCYEDVSETDWQQLPALVEQAATQYNADAQAAKQAAQELDLRWKTIPELQQTAANAAAKIAELKAQYQKLQSENEMACNEWNQAKGRAEQALSNGKKAREESNQTEINCEQAVQQAGFETVEECQKARMLQSERKELEKILVEYSHQIQSNQQKLEQLKQQIGNQQPPDLHLEQQKLEQIQKQYSDTNEQKAVVQNQTERLEQIQNKVKQKQGKFAKQQQQWQLRHDFAVLLKGEKGLSLARFILAKQLDLVTEQANLQLQKVHGGRYRLYRTVDVSTGRKTGLELEVEDAISGKRRSVNGLSGGEKFLVSLALSLGLSAVVQAQNGGIRIEAMFIDEGFGTLDPSSIADALDMLLSVQNSGRMVGIISHVEALRESIPNGIFVEKKKSGSMMRIF